MSSSEFECIDQAFVLAVSCETIFKPLAAATDCRILAKAKRGESLAAHTTPGRGEVSGSRTKPTYSTGFTMPIWTLKEHPFYKIMKVRTARYHFIGFDL